MHGLGIDEPLGRKHSLGALTYYHADGFGSISKMTDQTGAVVHEYRYGAWGNVETGAAQAGYAYTAREWDPEIGLYYYRARYYDPKVGRFISEDPIEFRSASNFYTYAFNEPIRLTDPDGKNPVLVGIVIFFGGVLVVTGAYVAITEPEAFVPWVTAVVTGPQMPGSEAATAATAGPEAATGAAAIVNHYENELPSILCDTEPWKSTDPECRKADQCEDGDENRPQ